MRRISVLAPFAFAALATALALSAPARADGDLRATPKRVCLSPAETREEIKSRRLREPFAMLKHATQHFKAEALSAKLCRIDDEFVYEIALLHRDGKYFRAYVDATTGKDVETKRPPAQPVKAAQP